MAKKYPKKPAPAAGPDAATARPCLGWCNKLFRSRDAGDRFCPACRRRRAQTHTSRRDQGCRTHEISEDP